jgi:hypothetical protein
MAAANLIRRVLIIYRKNTDQRPTAILPDVPMTNIEPIYLELDDAHEGCEHYNLLVPEDITSLSKGNQSILKPDQLEFCKSLLREDPLLNWWALGKELSKIFRIELSMPSLRRLHARLCSSFKNLTADILQAEYYGWAIAALETNPDISWWCLREQLKKQHKVTASNGVFERFYLNCKSLAQVTLRDLRASYKDIALSVLNDNPDMTSYGLLKHLQQQHQINTTDNAIRDFHRELKQGTLTLSEELAMNFDRLEDKGIRKTLQKHGWKGDVRQLCKKIFCLKEWMCEIKRLFSNTEPEPNTFALPLRELLDLCCSNDDFKFWSKLLCWKFCTKCGRRRPDAMNHLESVASCNHTCRQCDQPPDFMEKDVSFKTNVMVLYLCFFISSL